MMELIKGKLNYSASEDDVYFEIIFSKGKYRLSSNDVILLKDKDDRPMCIVGPMPETYSITALKELLGEYYPVFVQAAFDNNPVELCKISLE